MRKIVFVLIVASLSLLAAVPGLCQVISLDTIFATVEIPDSYTILTPANMENNAMFLQNKGTTADVMLQIFQAEGILVQAYGPGGDTCLQITALQDVDADEYFDIDQQTATIRAKYRREHLDGETFKALGITYDSAEWKNTKAYGRFLMLKYVQRLGGKVDHRGFARRTIRNGYTITVDFQVFGRGVTAKDNNALNDVMDTWRFTKVIPLSAAGSAGDSTVSVTGDQAAPSVYKVRLEQEPPRQINSGSFTVKGTALPGAQVIASVLRMGDATPILVENTANASGNFSLSVDLLQEGIYAMTLTVMVNGEETEELFFPEITYNKSLLPVYFEQTIPEELSSDKLVISGTTDAGAQVECTVNGKSDKKKVGRNGKFSFTINTAEEGNYSIALNFSKSGLNDQRFLYYATRVWTESEKNEKVKKEAIKPAYANLTAKIKGYTGRIMGYTAYVTEIAKAADDNWMVFMAFRKTNSAYRDIIVVMTPIEPNLTVDSKVKMYGRCTGMYLIQNDNREEEYPAFDLMFWDE